MGGETGPKIFIPDKAIRCRPGGQSTDKFGVFGYYGGHRVLRWRCKSKDCTHEVGPDGNLQRVVTFHHDDVTTGERVLPDERRPYVPRN